MDFLIIRHNVIIICLFVYRISCQFAVSTNKTVYTNSSISTNSAVSTNVKRFAYRITLYDMDFWHFILQKCMNSLEKIFVNEKFGIKYYTNRAI